MSSCTRVFTPASVPGGPAAGGSRLHRASQPGSPPSRFRGRGPSREPRLFCYPLPDAPHNAAKRASECAALPADHLSSLRPFSRSHSFNSEALIHGATSPLCGHQEDRSCTDRSARWSRLASAWRAGRGQRHAAGQGPCGHLDPQPPGHPLSAGRRTDIRHDRRGARRARRVRGRVEGSAAATGRVDRRSGRGRRLLLPVST